MRPPTKNWRLRRTKHRFYAGSRTIEIEKLEYCLSFKDIYELIDRLGMTMEETRKCWILPPSKRLTNKTYLGSGIRLSIISIFRQKRKQQWWLSSAFIGHSNVLFLSGPVKSVIPLYLRTTLRSVTYSWTIKFIIPTFFDTQCHVVRPNLAHILDL